MSTRRHSAAKLSGRANQTFTLLEENAPMPAMPPPDAQLIASLQESRSRWRALALLEAELVFELDAQGRIAFLAPETVLGRPAQFWLGEPAELLLGGTPGMTAQRGLRLWTSRADGSPCCLDVSAMLLPEGGLLGTARDVTAVEREAEIAGRALRRATTLGRLLRLGTRQRGAEAGAAAALEAMLVALPAALPAQGVALLAPSPAGWQWLAGNAAPTPDTQARHALAESSAGPALFAWRQPSQPRFDQDDRDLLAALAMPVAALQVEAARQAALDLAARGDALTGLLNRFAFDQGLADRLAVGAAGCLVFLDLDGLKLLNDQFGHEAGDAALRAMAARLRQAAGAQDLAARLGGDEFCLWLEGVTAPDAASRIAGLGAPGPIEGWPQLGPEALRASLGLVERRTGEAASELIARADAAMYVVKRQRGGRSATSGGTLAA